MQKKGAYLKVTSECKAKVEVKLAKFLTISVPDSI